MPEFIECFIIVKVFWASHGFDKRTTDIEQSEICVVLVAAGYIKEKPV